MTQATILVVEDDAILTLYLQDLLGRQGYTVLAAVSTGEEAVQVVSQLKPELILMDIELAGAMNGIQTAEVIARAQDIPVIFLTGYSQDPLLQEAKIAAPYGFLVKPVSERGLAATIEMALNKHRLDQRVKTSEARYRELIEQASDGIFVSDRDGTISEVNLAGCVMLARSRDEILRLNASELLAPEILKAAPLWQDELNGGQSIRVENWLRKKDGSIFPVDISARRLEDGCLQAIVRDISERKHLEQESRRTTDLLNLFVQNVPAGIAMFDREMRYIAASRHYLEIYRLPEQNLIGRSHYEIFPEIPERWKDIHRRCLNGAVDYCAEDPFPRADGSLDWVRWRIEPWYESPGKIGGIVLFSEIITEQKQMLQELQESEQKFRDLFEKHAAVKLLIDPVDGTIVDANHAAEKFYGWTVEQIKQMRIQDINALAPELVREEMEKARRLERIYFEFVHNLADGSLRNVEVYSSSVEINGKTLLHLIVHDITAQKKVADTLRVSEERFQILTGLLPVGVFLTDAQGQILFANEQWLKDMGVSIEIAQSQGALSAIHPEDRAAIVSTWDQLVALKGKQGLEYRILKPDGTLLWVYGLATVQYDEKGQFLGYIGAQFDITERKQADLRLTQQLDELRRWNEITIGRETRILELKKEINQLLAHMGEGPRYASVEANI